MHYRGGQMLRRSAFFVVWVAGTFGLGSWASAAPNASGSVARSLTSDSPAQVAMGLRQLDGTPSPGLEDALFIAAQRPEAELSSAALDLLSQTGDPRAVDLLEAAMRSLDPSRVSVACVWLPRFGALGLDVAERLLDDPDPLVQRTVLRTLAWFPPGPEIQVMVERVVDARAAVASRLADGGAHGIR